MIRTAILSCIVFPILLGDYALSSVNVPTEHWAYRYLDRLWTTGVLERNLSSIRPLSRSEVARLLAEAMQAAEAGDECFTAADLGELEWLKMEFAYELARLGCDPGKKRERNFYRRETDGDHLVVDLVFRSRAVRRDRGEDYYRFIDTVWGPSVRGGFGDRLSYSADFRKGFIRSNKGLPKDEAGIRGYYSINGAQAEYDIGDASVVYGLPKLSLELGKEKLSWGPGHRGNLILSDNPPSFYFLKLAAKYGPVRYTSLLGALRTDVKGKSYRTDDSLFVRTINTRKYLAAQRLEMALHPSIRVGLSEAIVYGERGIDPAYLNPLMFYWPAQHDGGDQDNLVMGADIMVRPTDGLRFYGSLMLDEIHLGGFLSGNARNKTAAQAGFHLAAPVGLRDLDLRGDYTRVQPGVYTHKFPVNTYASWETPLGYWTGENSDEAYVEAIYRPRREFWGVFSLFTRRLGEPTPQPYAQNPDPDKYPFLHGTVESAVGFGLRLNFEPIYNLVLSLGFSTSGITNYRHIEGEKVRENEISLALFSKY